MTMTLLDAVPPDVREAIEALIDLYGPLGRLGKVRLSWRGGILRRVEVRGLSTEYQVPALDPDAMDVVVTMQCAGFVQVEDFPNPETHHERFAGDPHPLWVWIASNRREAA